MAGYLDQVFSLNCAAGNPEFLPWKGPAGGPPRDAISRSAHGRPTTSDTIDALSRAPPSPFVARKRACNGEKFLLPLQVKLAKGVDELVCAIFYSRDAITTSQLRHRLLRLCRFEYEVRAKRERRDPKVLCDPCQK